ncbi:MAG: hypothetical protein ACE5JX_16565 [Acidobacteriota bacterium]
MGPDGTVYLSTSEELVAINTSSMGLADSPWPMLHHDAQHTARQGNLPDTSCLLNLGASRNHPGLTLEFDLATPTPTQWNLWVTAGDRVLKIWSLPLPVTDRQLVPVVIDELPPIGTIGFLTSLTSNDRTTCSDWATVDTGSGEGAINWSDLKKLFALVDLPLGSVSAQKLRQTLGRH